MVALKVWRVKNLRDTVFIETILFLMCLVLISLPFFPAWSLVMSELWIHQNLYRERKQPISVFSLVVR